MVPITALGQVKQDRTIGDTEASPAGNIAAPTQAIAARKAVAAKSQVGEERGLVDGCCPARSDEDAAARAVTANPACAPRSSPGCYRAMRYRSDIAKTYLGSQKNLDWPPRCRRRNHHHRWLRCLRSLLGAVAQKRGLRDRRSRNER